MVQEVDNGRCIRWRPDKKIIDNNGINGYHTTKLSDPDDIMYAPLPVEDIKNHTYKYHTTSYKQFQILLNRMLLQTWRDSVRYFFLLFPPTLFCQIFKARTYTTCSIID